MKEIDFDKIFEKSKKLGSKYAQLIHDEITDMELTVAEASSVCNLAHGYMYAAMIKFWYQFADKEKQTPEEFKEHSLDAIDIFFNAIKDVKLPGRKVNHA